MTSRSYIQQPAKQSQVEKFRATQVFHTKFTANVAIIRWTMPLEKAFYLPQLCFSFFFSVLPQDRRNPAVRRINFVTNLKTTDKTLKKN